MPILVCGSIAYDTVMVFEDKFKLEKTSAGVLLNEYFIVPDLRRDFGGCAGNIVYNLRLLDKVSVPVSTVGMDFSAYADWLDSLGIDLRYIKEMDHTYTAQTLSILDADGNRVTAFHPGAMMFSQYNAIRHDEKMKLAVIAPDGVEGMKTHARQLAEAEIPFLFYPGPMLYQLDGDELLEFFAQASWLVVKARDLAYLEAQARLDVARLSERMAAVIICDGHHGARIYAQDVHYQIPSACAPPVADESGCDDAFCAGLLYGLHNELDWETTGRVAMLLWGIAAEHHGAQKHTLSFAQLQQRFQEVFGYALLA